MELTRPIDDNARLRAIAGPMIRSGLGETFGAAFGVDTMLGLVSRDMAISRAESAAVGRNPRRGGVRREAVETRLSPDELNERYGETGARFDRPMTDDAARLIADARRAQTIREDVIARGPGGLMGGAAVLGGSLAAMAVDPLEVAAAFIPVVGPARSAALTARFGRVGGRAIEGAIEGAVGNALVEPIYLGLSKTQQLDYDFRDALANIALGGLLGLGLGAGAGLLRRTTSAQAIEPPFAFREPSAAAKAARVALAQAAQGKQVDVAPLAAMRRPRTLLETISDGGGVHDTAGDLQSMGLRDWDRGRPFKKNALREDGEPQDVLARALWEDGWFRDEPEAGQMLRAERGETEEPDLKAVLQRAIDRELRGEPMFRTPGEREAWAAFEQSRTMDAERAAAVEELEALGVDAPRLEDVDAAIVMARQDGLELADAYERAVMDAERREATALASRDADFSADVEAARNVERAPPDPDLEAELADWEAMSGQLALDANEVAFLAEADGYMAKARAVADTARTAALCLAR